jgi:hypothetical protein
MSRWLQTPPKRRLTQDLHGVTSQKAAFLIVTAVKTSNLTCENPCVLQLLSLQTFAPSTSANKSSVLLQQKPTPSYSATENGQRNTILSETD